MGLVKKIERRKRGMMETYGKHKRRIEDGIVRAEEAGEFAIGELLIGRSIKPFPHQIFHSSLSVLPLSRPAISPVHTHLSLSLSPSQISV